ncbi:ubiquitin carboxyl-terminal hydrolase, partial [Cardiosporidium cionae]
MCLVCFISSFLSMVMEATTLLKLEIFSPLPITSFSTATSVEDCNPKSCNESPDPVANAYCWENLPVDAVPIGAADAAKSVDEIVIADTTLPADVSNTQNDDVTKGDASSLTVSSPKENLRVVSPASRKRSTSDNNSTEAMKKRRRDTTLNKSSLLHRTHPCLVLSYNSSIPVKKIRESRVTGLVNLAGGSCFLNVIIQCLSHVKPFRDFYLDCEGNLPSKALLGKVYRDYIQYLAKFHFGKEYSSRSGRRFCRNYELGASISWELAAVINHIWRCDDSVKYIKPDALYNSCVRVIPHFDPRDMQDCDEFFRLLMDILDGELKAARVSKPLNDVMLKLNAQGVKTHVSLLFEGIERDELCCCHCKKRSYRLVPFKTLAVAMTSEAQQEANYYAGLRVKPQKFLKSLSKVELTECLRFHFKADTTSLSVSTGEGYNCSNCNTKQDAIKHSRLLGDHLPYVLCVSLKRFVRGKDTYKIWNPVHFEEFLDLSDYIVAPESSSSFSSSPKNETPQ